jgi:hypothetical protein
MQGQMGQAPPMHMLQQHQMQMQQQHMQ